jgi:hypothetical protein
MTPRASLAPLYVPGGLICVAVLGIVLLGDLSQRLVPFLLCFGLAFGAYLFGVWHTLRLPSLAPGPRLWPILALALAWRLALLPLPPTLSDDLYRYAWEGRVLATGVSPYREAPSATGLIPLRDGAVWPLVNNPDVPSPYPPLAQLAGLLGWALDPGGTGGVKLVSTLADLGTIGALLLLLRATGRPLGRVLVYAWHPLPLVAFALSGHNDSLMVCALTLGLALVSSGRGSGRGGESSQRAGRRWTSALCFACAALCKVTPLLLLPLLPRKLGWGPTLLAGAVFVLAYVPFLVLGGGATGSLLTYLGTWKDNDSLHGVLYAILGPAGAKSAALVLLLGGVALVALHPALRRRPLWWQAYAVLGLAILAASTVHSWYLTWLLPPLALALVATPEAPWLGPPASAGWLLFSGLVALPYLTYDGHWWSLWLSFVQYVPLYALLAVGVAGALWRIHRRPPLPYTAE